MNTTSKIGAEVTTLLAMARQLANQAARMRRRGYSSAGQQGLIDGIVFAAKECGRKAKWLQSGRE